MEEKIIYKSLSYKIVGILYKVHNETGRYCNEKQFCDIIEENLKQSKIIYERERTLPPNFKGEKPGRNRIDFLIEDKIVLEVKTKDFLTREDYFQVRRYLTSLNKKLGIIVNFRDIRLHPKRILNS